MRLARDTNYEGKTLKLMKDLIEMLARMSVELVKQDEKTYQVRALRGGGFQGKVWTKDFTKWYVHSSTILKLKKLRL